ncbi:hypothetical protein M406DRAFT_260943 [Cryphonectria parasitica EP155]|uniref:RZ-type domain-containing protein n=1 Tax=Cryphonectria parasitica (strain ATCC 38755 / EP155) TaxID=660469 RepID=A0A9P4XZ65_CRYP1|nr:uncharacterized protein M406DRAFT_260943 [Cryphonectria parasitica EP155]KAF3763606.1 hypothetical protein M406DRAFT_260943 [Cryphonectria parasitica EP155]
MGGNKLRAWKRILARGEESSNVPYDTVSLFFELSLALMEGDIAISQEAVKLLAGDAGLNFIKAVSSTHIVQAAAATDADSSSIRVELWKTQISPMFRLITNERLLDSNVLEQEVAAIYSFLVGVNATRMDRLFGFITQLVMDWPGLPVGDLAQGTVLELSLTVLSKVLDCNTTNVLNERFHHIVEQFSNILTTLSATPGEKNDEACILRATKYLDYLQRRLGVGKTMMATANLAESSPATAGDPAGPSESFKLRRDLPGKLSPDGPRHDNDHAEIASIQIMPTSEEITSPRKEYLPTTDSSQWHLPGIRGRLDREFRLLREDTVGQLRDAVFELLQGTRDNINSNKRHNQNSAQTTAYDDAVVHSVDIDKNNGLELTVRCSQPKIVQKMSDAARNRWWEQCKRLQAGALTCVIDRAGAAQFYVVARSTVRSASQKETSARKRGEPSSPPPFYQEEDKEKPLSLSYSREDLFVKLNLVGTSRVEMQQTLRWYKDIGRPRPRQLVEFPGVLLASFKHTLEALQKLSRKPDLPFTHLIAPDTPSSSPPPLRRVESRVAPPLFSRAAGFEYDLKCLNSGGLSPLSVRPGQHMPSIEEVSENTGLDETQSEALLNTLTRELSLIQGPPGTGKSYTGEKIIRVLLANKAKAKLGPIICVCYTNHALDQLLEHLLDDGIKGILRIGSSSKSERLKNFNLRAVADKSAVAATRTETYIIGGQTRKMRTAETEMKKCLRTLDQCDSASSMGNYLEMNHPVFHKELFGPAADDGSRGDVLSGGGQWETVTRRSKPGKVVETWLRGGSRPPPPGPGHNHNNNPPPRDLADLQRTRLNDMTHLERQIIHREWQKSIRNPVFKEIMALHREHEEARTFRNTIRDEEDLRCLQQADIIGLTTTGLARQVDMMRKVRAKVVICEEAGEVLEAHVLTALLPSVEQLILIGDHLQLRPQIQNYDLQSTNPKGLKYSLDTSLFERLVCPQHSEDQKLPVSVLATQRRMHPSIAEMVRSTLYSNLKDASHVESYPEVVGMDRRLFWLHHEHLEDGQHAKGGEPHDTSRSNEFEVEMAAALVSHVVKQGNYDPEDIAVLTPYTGQLQKLRRRLATEASFCVQIDERDLQALDEEGLNEAEEETKAVATTVGKSTLLKSIRLATVDNFQGEEAKVVIISLVRSNMENRCGFLSTSNRINVLLSRAKHGCYILGNAKTYQSVAMWEQVIKLLQANDNFGTALALKCPRHPATRIEVSSPDDFAIFSPDGGCRLPCLWAKLLDMSSQLHSNLSRPAKYCQQCGADDILATVVDYLLLSEYKDIDLNDDPCVFASCGHFLTRSSMDGQMLMGEHYVLDDKDGGPVAIRKPLEPFSMDGRSQLKTCPQCRGSLRDIPRYGRIVRRALLDEATKKFISWSEHQHHQLAGRLLDLQNNLAAQQQEQNGEKGKGDAAAAAEDIAAQILDYMPGRFALKGSAQDQLRELGKWVGKKRYTELIRLHRDIVTFRGRVRAEEQPFQKVANLVRFANSNKTVDSSSSSSSSSFTFDSSVIQLRGFLLATSLLLRCHLTVLSDFLDLRTKKDTASCAWKHADISVDFARNTAQCEDLVRLASETDRPQLQAEGHIYHAHFCGLALALGNGNGNSNGSGDDKNNNNNSSSSSLEHIAAAQTILDKRSPQPHWAATVQAELDAVRDLLSQGIFYTRVTAAEMRAVYKAMAAEFRGTGHWYTCERGHPFTVGECGMPMEQARCPECGAAVGGRNHVAVEGVRHAVEVEALARGVEGMAI